VLAGQPHALEVHGDAAVERLHGELGGGGITQREAGAHVVVQDVQPAEALVSGRHEAADGVLVGGVGLVRPGLAALAVDQVDRVLRRRLEAIDHQHPSTLAGQHHRHRSPVADRLAGGLPAPHDDRRLALDPLGHLHPPEKVSRI
jgi:hypothetical protein